MKLKENLETAVKLNHFCKRYIISVFTDALDKQGTGVVMQVSQNEVSKEVEPEDHQSIAFLGGRFNKTQKDEQLKKKEAFAIIKLLERMALALGAPDLVKIYPDHRSLLFVFAPVTLRPGAPRYVSAKVYRWDVHMPHFEFAMKHIKGVKIVFSHLLTRWSKGNWKREVTCDSILLFVSIKRT